MRTFFSQFPVKKMLFSFAFFIGLIFLLLPLQRVLDQIYPGYQWDPQQYNYQPGRFKKMIPSKYHSLMGEIFWLKLIQFTYNDQFQAHQPIENLMRLFNIATTLEPSMIAVYDYTLMIYSGFIKINPPIILSDMLKIASKGIKANPTHWMFYIQKAQIYKAFQDFNRATEVLYQASLLPGAPSMLDIFAFYNAISTQNYEIIRNTLINLNKKTLTLEEKKWLKTNSDWFKAFQYRAELNQWVTNYHQQTGRYPIASWEKLTAQYLFGLVSFAPRDPEGYPYQLDKQTGKIDLDPTSPLYVLDRTYQHKHIKANPTHERH